LVLKIPYVSLVNLIMNETVVKELLQNDFNELNLLNELKELTGDEDVRREMLKKYRELKHILGEKGASAQAAFLIREFITHRENSSS
jgi:lipid-A-disaccharide synthase